ncbi:MAG: cytochrome c oxidase cbb3-type subunit [Bacteroidota bacterium]|nr:cytochrome c oxidase cbb3-type subunit [Bacteroidota bacterium]
MAKAEDKILEHNYDGIKEYDNPLPPWWTYLFIITIIWSGLYIFYYEIAGIGSGSAGEYSQEIKDYQTRYASILSVEAGVNWNEPNFELDNDINDLAMAKNLFIKNCVSCHGAEGQGGIGANLTDNYWIHGGGINNIAKIIALGVPEKGMITWKKTFKKKEIIALASYILSLNGTNPPNPKAPQGQLYEEKN